MDKPHNSTNATLLHDGSKRAHGHKLKDFNPKHPIIVNATAFANKTFSIPLPDNDDKVQPIPFKLLSKQKVANSSNGRAFSPLLSLPHSTNTTLRNKAFSNVLPPTANVSSNSTLFSDIFPQAVKKFSRMNIPKPVREKMLGKPIVASKSNPVKPYSLNRVSYGNVPLMGAQKVQNSVGRSYNKNIMLNKKLQLPFRKGFPYGKQLQQPPQQQQLTATGVSNPRYPSFSNNLGYPQKQLNQFGKTSQSSATSGAVRSSFPSQLDKSKNLNQYPKSPYAAYKQQLQRLRASQASQSSLFNKQTKQNVQNWQGNRYGNAYGNSLVQGAQGSQPGQRNQLTQTNRAWQNVQRLQGNQAWRGYPGTGPKRGQASFPGYGGLTGYPGTSFQGQNNNQNAPQIGRRRKRDIHDNPKRTKRQGGNMVWYNNYNNYNRQPGFRSQVYRPSPTVSEDNEEPFLANVQTGFDNPKGLLNQQDPLSYNVDYFHRPTPYVQSVTYTLGNTQPSPTRATTSERQSEFGLFPTNGVTDQASTRGSFSSPIVPGKDYLPGFNDLMPPAAGGKSQDLIGFGQPQVQQQIVPTSKPFPLPFPLPISTTKNPFFMKEQNLKVPFTTMSPLTTTQAMLKSTQDTKPSSKPSTALLKPTMKPSADVTQSSAESAILLKKKLMGMVKNKGTVKPLIHDVTEHVMDDVYREKNRAPMFGGDIALIVDTLRQLSRYSKYTNPPETIDTLKVQDCRPLVRDVKGA